MTNISASLQGLVDRFNLTSTGFYSRQKQERHLAEVALGKSYERDRLGGFLAHFEKAAAAGDPARIGAYTKEMFAKWVLGDPENSGFGDHRKGVLLSYERDNYTARMLKAVEKYPEQQAWVDDLLKMAPRPTGVCGDF